MFLVVVNIKKPKKEKQNHGHRQADQRMEPIKVEEPVSRISPQHQKFSMGDIDNSHHPEDDGEARGHQRVQTADEQAVDQVLSK